VQLTDVDKIKHVYQKQLASKYLNELAGTVSIMLLVSCIGNKQPFCPHGGKHPASWVQLQRGIYAVLRLLLCRKASAIRSTFKGREQ
jgi:hypothetical protein